MNPHLPDAESIFTQAIELESDAERTAFLDQACGNDPSLRSEIEKLIADHLRADEYLPEPATSFDSFQSGSAMDWCGQTIGPYKLLEVIGEGGMGTVYMADQSLPVRRRVALKVIKTGMDTRQVIARFEAERQALALMDHPNIAKVLDAGATDSGRPYFVMELVYGKPITQYCDEHRLDTKSRLKLFQRVCQAVQHAHQKGIIHRDIKPSNILVGMYDDQPVPKVIDFGVAKAAGEKLTEKTMFTRFGQILGTLEYMSPEQGQFNNVDIDTRSDIYSLGAILYELLTGDPPFERERIRNQPLDETLRMIREEEPTRPSTRLSATDHHADIASRRQTSAHRLGLKLRGELDWIVIKALAKNRARRYETANGLATDIERFLNGEPVEAGAPSTVYRLGKYIRKHKLLLASSAALIVLLGVVTAVLAISNSLIQNEQTRTLSALNEARDQRDRAQSAERRVASLADELRDKLKDVEIISDFQGSMLKQLDVFNAGQGLKDIVSSNFDMELARENLPETERVSRATEFQNQQRKVNFSDVARDFVHRIVLQPTADEINARFQTQPLIAASLREVLAERLNELGLYEESLRMEEQALDTRRTVLGENDRETLRSLRLVGEKIQALGRHAEANEYLQKAVKGCRENLGIHDEETILAIKSHGALLFRLGDFDLGESLLRESLDNARVALGDAHKTTLECMNDLGRSLGRREKNAEAEKLLREVVDTVRANNGDVHGLANALTNLGNILGDENRPTDAEQCLREAIDVKKGRLGLDHPGTQVSIGHLGKFLLGQGRLTEANELISSVYERCKAILGENHPQTIGALFLRSKLLCAQRKLADAEVCARESVMRARSVNGQEDLQTLEFTAVLAEILTGLGKLDEAESLFCECLEKYRRVAGNGSAETLGAINNMGFILNKQGRTEAAEEYYREAFEKMAQSLGKEHANTLISMGSLGLIMTKNGRFAEGQQFEREASEGLDRVMGRSNPIALNYKGNLASTLNEIGNSPEAELLYREILSIANESLPVNYPPLSNWKSGLGTSLRDQGRLDEAEPYIIDALTSRRELLGEQHPETMMSKISLAQLRVAQNRYEDAIKLLESIENDGQSVLVGPRALSYGMLLMTMGHARLKIGEFSESERNLLKAEEVLSRVPIARGRRLRQSIETIIDLYLTWDATEDTEAHVEDVEYWKVQLHEVEQTSERHRPQIEKQ